MSEFLLNISGTGPVATSLEIWVGMALIGALGFVLGFAMNRGSICTVIATTELVSEKRPARFIALVECAVWAALVYAILEMSPTMQQGWSPLGYLARISHSQWLVSACPRQRAGWRRAAQQAPQTDCFSPKYGKLRKSAASRLFWKNV